MDKLPNILKKESVVLADGMGLVGQTLMPTFRLVPDQSGETNATPVNTISVMELGKMLLHYAKEGDTLKVHELMTRGAPFTTDWLGTSALHLAAMNNHLETCEVLLRAGISKDARTKVERTPLHLAVYNGNEAIVQILLANNCEVDARDMLKMTPLHWAVEKNHLSIVKILLSFGADPTAVSKFDKTPLSLSIERNFTDIFQELIARHNRVEADEERQATETIVNEMQKSNPKGVLHSSSAGKQTVNTFTMGGNKKEAAAVPATITNDKKQMNQSTLELLENHGISFLPVDETDNTLIHSALQCGRKIALSDAGKLALNDPKCRKAPINQSPVPIKVPKISQMNALNQIGVQPSTLHTIAERRKPPILTPAPVRPILPAKTNKVIKILSAEEFQKMIINGTIPNSVKRIPADSVQYVKRLNTVPMANGGTSRKGIMNKYKLTQISNPVIQTNPTPAKSTSSNKQLNNIVNNLISKSSNTVQSTTVTQTKPSHQPSAIIDLDAQDSSDLDIPTLVPFSNSNIGTQPSISNIQQSITPAPLSTVTMPSITGTTVTNTTQSTTNGTVATVVSNESTDESSKTQPMSMPEIERHILELRKETDELRKKLELTEKQMEEYKTRLEKLEQL